MIPLNKLSTTAVYSTYLTPDNYRGTLLKDYEAGGISLNDTSTGLYSHIWTMSYIEPDVIITGPQGAWQLFSFSGISELNFTFDQAMQPFVAYVRDDVAWYWWYNPLEEALEHVEMAGDVVTPRCCLDDKRLKQTPTSDIVLSYIRGTTLYCRQQLDRFGIEYTLATDVEPPLLLTVGMSKGNRLQWICQEEQR